MFGAHRRRREKRRKEEAKMASEQGVPIEQIKAGRKQREMEAAEKLSGALFNKKSSSRSTQLRKERDEFENEKKAYESQRAANEQSDEADMENKINKKVQQAKEHRNLARKEGREYARDVHNQEQEGLSPQRKQELLQEGNQDIHRSLQAASRKLLGEQAQRGIMGKGGVGYAQQKDLYRMGREAKAGVRRDVNKIDQDLANKKLANMFNIESGEAAQSQLDRQLAADELNLSVEKKRQRALEDQFNKLLTRI